jgi:hypothetical protein
VFVGLALVVLVALTGLAVDGANAFNQRRNATNGADAAAVAGTRAITVQKKAGGGDSSAVFSEIESYLVKHHLDDALGLEWSAYYVDRHATRLTSDAEVTNTSADVPSGAYGVEVELRYRFATFFMSILGQPDLTVSGKASAIYGPASTVVGGDLIPLAVSQQAAQQSQDGQNVCIFGSDDEENPCGDSGAYQITPGNFGQVAFDPAGTNAPGDGSSCEAEDSEDSLGYWWCQGSQYPIYLGMQLSGDPGMLSNSLAEEIDWRIDNRRQGLVPVFGYVNDENGNNTTFTIVGFMAIELVSYDVTAPADERWVLAKKIGYYTTAGSIGGGAVDTGVYAINLVR